MKQTQSAELLPLCRFSVVVTYTKSNSNFQFVSIYVWPATLVYSDDEFFFQYSNDCEAQRLMVITLDTWNVQWYFCIIETRNKRIFHLNWSLYILYRCALSHSTRNFVHLQFLLFSRCYAFITKQINKNSH